MGFRSVSNKKNIQLKGNKRIFCNKTKHTKNDDKKKYEKISLPLKVMIMISTLNLN